MQKQILTAQEVADAYHVSLSSLQTNFNRTKESIKKKYGITIEKVGRGAAAQYHIVNFSYQDTSRALTLYSSLETNCVPIAAAASLLDLHFLIFIGIISSPQRVFRGSYLELLQYLDLKPSRENLQSAKQALYSLAEKDYIMFLEDKTDPTYFMAGVLRKTETEMELEIQAVLYFKHLVEKTRKSWIPLMKVYLALHIVGQPCTIAELADITNLSEYKVRDSLAILYDNNMLLKEKVIHRNPVTQDFYCLGTNISLNAFGIPEDLS